MFIKDGATRAYIYGIIAAGGGLALIYGIVSGEQLAGWLALGAATLGNSLALANTDKGRHEA